MIKKIVNYIGDGHNSKTLMRLLYITLAIIVLADFLVPREHGVFPWDDIPGFNAVYGFFACIIIVIVSKFLGHQVGLMKDEDYYGD